MTEHVPGPVATLIGFDSDLLLQLAALLIAHREGNGRRTHQFADAAGLGHVAILRLIVTMFQMVEERFNYSSNPIDGECLTTVESNADYHQTGIAAVANAFGGEADPHSGNSMRIVHKRPPAMALTPPANGFSINHGVSLQLDHEVNPHQATGARQHSPDPSSSQNTRIRQDGKHVLDEGDAVTTPGIVAFGGFRQNPPDDGPTVRMLM